jgi:hypothetical protein
MHPVTLYVDVCIRHIKSNYLLNVFEAGSAFIVQVINKNINGPNIVGVIFFFFYMMKAEPGSGMFNQKWDARTAPVYVSI